MSRRVVVLRHGRTAHNAAGIWQGQLDTALDDTGREQAARAAAGIAALRPDLVISSDLARAADTARAVAQAAGVPLRLDPRLREIHAGQWQGLTQAEVAERFPAQEAAVHAGEDLRRGVDGERVVDVVARARPAFDEIVAGLPADATAVLVTHGVTARALVLDVLGLDQGAGWRALAGLRNACWAELEQHAVTGAWRLAVWNAGLR